LIIPRQKKDLHQAGLFYLEAFDSHQSPTLPLLLIILPTPIDFLITLARFTRVLSLTSDPSVDQLSISPFNVSLTLMLFFNSPLLQVATTPLFNNSFVGSR
jgi:hypothetical protein